LVHLDQLTTLFADATATVDDHGVITATLNGTTYVFQPEVAVQQDVATGLSQLVVGNDGVYRFIDAQGNSQTLHPAFAEQSTLRSILQETGLSATLTIQPDSTAKVTLGGKDAILVPDVTLGAIPAEHSGQALWRDAPSRYRFVDRQTPNTSQGFTVVGKP
jgi:hypothetical protein